MTCFSLNLFGIKLFICLVGWDGDAAVPMVEAMVALVLVDQLMAQYAQCNLFPINPDLQEPLSLPRLEPANV